LRVTDGLLQASSAGGRPHPTLGLLPALRRLRDQAIQFEEQGAEGIRGLRDVIRGTELERVDGRLFVPLDNENDGRVHSTRGSILQDGEGIHPGMVVLDEQDVEGKLEALGAELRWNRLKAAVWFRESLDDLNRPAGIPEAPARQIGVAEVEQPQRLRRGVGCRLELPRAADKVRHAGEERLRGRHGVVCPGFDGRQRTPVLVRGHDDDSGVESAGANLPHEREAALILDIGFDDEGCDVGVIVDPA
jgi:hypothetical protein